MFFYCARLMMTPKSIVSCSTLFVRFTFRSANFSLLNNGGDENLIKFLKIYKWTVSYSKFSRYESLVSRRLREQLVAMAGLVVVSERAAHWPELTRPQIYCTKRPDSTRCATRVPCLSTTTTTVMHQLHLNFTNKEYKATKYFVFRIKSTK